MARNIMSMEDLLDEATGQRDALREALVSLRGWVEDSFPSASDQPAGIMHQANKALAKCPAPPDGSPERPFRTLAEAIKNHKPGETIFVGANGRIQPPGSTATSG